MRITSQYVSIIFYQQTFNKHTATYEITQRICGAIQWEEYSGKKRERGNIWSESKRCGVGMKLGPNDMTIPLPPLFSSLLSYFFLILSSFLSFSTPVKWIKTHPRYFTCYMNEYFWASALLPGSHTHFAHTQLLSHLDEHTVHSITPAQSACVAHTYTHSLHSRKMVVNIIYLHYDFPVCIILSSLQTNPL